MSLELVLAGLFPPRMEQIWSPAFLNWQPVPYNYFPVDKDQVLVGTRCPNYLKLYKEYQRGAKQQNENDKYRDVFNYISQNTGLNITQFSQVYNLYFGLSTEVKIKLSHICITFHFFS